MVYVTANTQNQSHNLFVVDYFSGMNGGSKQHSATWVVVMMVTLVKSVMQ